MALETFFKTQKSQTLIGDEEYAEWIKPLLTHQLWHSVTPVASELPLYDTRRNVAGTADGIVAFTDGTYALLDLKTQSSTKSRPYDTKPQLGAYLAMINEHYPKLYFTRCLTLWAQPGRTRLESHNPDDCWAAWDDVFQRYELTHRPF